MSSGSVTKAPQYSSSSPYASTESLDHRLKFGQKIYFEDVSVAATPPTQVAKTSGGVSSKKGRSGSVHGAQPPRCQVESCKVDLSGAKTYYSRHKVCSMHSKSPTVVVAGLEQRFCQQCSRFHLLSEFDQGKRSCRRRLAGHNERRRKPPPRSILTSRNGRLSSPIFDNSDRASGFVMEYASYPKLLLRNTLPTPRSPELVLRNHTATISSWQANSDKQSDLFLQGSRSGGTSFLGSKHPLVDDSNCALSLLSSQTWCSRNNTAPTSVELNNNNMLNFNGTPITTQFAGMSPQAATIHQLPNVTSWYFKDLDSGSFLPEGGVYVAELGLSQILPPRHSHLIYGELDMSQQGRRHYMDLEESRFSQSSHHWSL